VPIIAQLAAGVPRPELVAKLGVVEEESDESALWLELIIEGEFLRNKVVEALLQEANALVKIMAKSRLSASRSLCKPNRQSAIGNRK
jgi:hypothetical protein